MSKVDICTEVTGNPFMIGELFAVIRGDRMGSDGQRLKEFDHHICHGLSVPSVVTFSALIR